LKTSKAKQSCKKGEAEASISNRKGYLGASGQKSDLAIRFGDPYFLLQVDNSSVGIHACCLAISFVRMRRKGVNSVSGLKTTLTVVCSDHDFLYRD